MIRGDVVITVELHPLGDITYATSPEGAALAARTMWDEGDIRSTRPCVTFTVNDVVVYRTTRRTDLGAA